jgi:glycosyltransferase involved in cell wall biosynthesis
LLDAIWISWEKHVRNRSLSAQLGVELHELVSRRVRPLRYLSCTLGTILLIERHQPRVVFAPNPSIVLTCLLLGLKGVLGYRFATDAHYAGIVAANRNWVIQKVLDFCNRHADLVIVTNEEHQRYVESIGGNALICEDPLPDIEHYAEGVTEQVKKIFCICSFDVDEPYVQMFEAAAILQAEGYSFWVSGNYTRSGIVREQWPHVNLLGYVSIEEFYLHLAESQVVVDLTMQENCLLCGAYEAMAINKPLVTSKTSALQKYFTGGTVFVCHEPEAIAEGIRQAYSARIELKRQIEEWKRDARARSKDRIERIRGFLNLSKQIVQ